MGNGRMWGNGTYIATYVESTSHESNTAVEVVHIIVLVAEAAEPLPWLCTIEITAKTVLPAGSLLCAAILGQLSMALNLAGCIRRSWTGN